MDTHSDDHRPAGGAVALSIVLLALAALLLPAGPVRADFGPGTFSVALHDGAGTPATQAGAHADLTTAFSLNTATGPAGPVPDGTLKEARVDLPAGLYGDPGVVPQCTAADFNDYGRGCPVASQVGVMTVQVAADTGNPASFVTVPVFDMETVPGETAAFAAAVVGTPVRISVTVPAGNGYRLRASIRAINQGVPIYATTLTLWGVPADPSHDAERYVNGPLAPPGGASSQPRRPFLSAPPACAAAPQSAFSARSWQHPAIWVTASATLPAMTGCDRLRFAGLLTMQPATTRVDAPSAFDAELTVPQDTSTTGLATPELRSARVELPQGVSVSPSSADGLQACTDEQLGLGTDDGPSCPDASKIGSATLTTPVLPDTLQGDIVLRRPTDADLFRIALVIPGPGLLLKIPGVVDADAVTGRLTARFDDAPALPFSAMHLHFNGGARAPLATPPACGVAATHTTLTAWDGSASSSVDTFGVTADGAGAACPATPRFAPSLAAGTTNPLAGAFSPFTLTVRRADGDQVLRTLTVDLPSGLLAAVGGVPLCAEADASAGTCGAASRIGTTTVQAGPGPHPFSLGGTVSLGGPYKGRPFSLSIVVRALAGPFDLGTVVVRAPVSVDAAHARLTVPADPLPTILRGVPLRLRTVSLTLDRPRFTFNATSCAPMSIGATLTSDTGTTRTAGAGYQALGCAGLPFAPVTSAASSGRLAFRRGAALSVHIGVPAGNAAIRSVAVTLPRELPSRLVPTINNACLVGQFEADHTKCPEDSYVGTVTARTPILPEPLTGPAYIVARPHDKPRISLLLNGRGIGKGIDLQLDGTIVIDSGGGRTQVTFDHVPDVPITAFDLDLPAGPHSALDAPMQDLCKGGLALAERLTGQNGAVLEGAVPVRVTDCPRIGRVRAGALTRAGRTVRVRVTAPAPGLITVGGMGLERVARRADRPGTYTVRTRLTTRAVAILARRHRLSIRANVVFRPDNAPSPSTASAGLVVRRRAGEPK